MILAIHFDLYCLTDLVYGGTLGPHNHSQKLAISFSKTYVYVRPVTSFSVLIYIHEGRPQTKKEKKKYLLMFIWYCTSTTLIFSGYPTPAILAVKARVRKFKPANIKYRG